MVTKARSINAASLWAIAAVIEIGLMGTPASAQVVQSDTIFGFGDSLLDTRRTCATEFGYPNGGYGTCSNGRGVLQWLPDLTNYSFNKANDYAVGFSGTSTEFFVTVQPGVTGQIQEFQADGGQIRPNDLVVLSGATNNSFALFVPGVTPQLLAQQSLSEQRNNVAALIGLGASNFVVYSSGGAAAVQAYAQGGFYNGGTPIPVPLSPGAGTYFTLYDAGLARMLTPFANSSTRIQIFDQSALREQVIANPTAYGFSAALSCVADPGCLTAPKAIQNLHYNFDVHPTEAGQLLNARYIANLLGSGSGIAAQGDLASYDAVNWNDAILARLDQDHVILAQNIANVTASYASAKAPALAPIEVGKWSIYSSGNFASGSQVNSANASGFKYNIGGGRIGGEFRPSARSLVGIAFNYSQPNAALDNNSGSIKMDHINSPAIRRLHTRTSSLMRH